MDIGVAVTTYGDINHWEPLARNAAVSAESQTVEPSRVIWHHDPGNSLSKARNEASDLLGTEWQIFLDADDTLEHRYIEAMVEAIDEPGIYRPATRGKYPNGDIDEEAIMLVRSDLMIRNFIVIGAAHRKEDFDECGGFKEFPILEDWELWLNLHKRLKRPIFDVPDAEYWVTVIEDSRNQQEATHGRMYAKIRRSYAQCM